jgi:hypothetical protein
MTNFDPDGELKVTAAVLYPASDLPDDQLLRVVREMPTDERAEILAASVGARTNRRHKPGRAWERIQYRFDVLCDYGAYRDLQRHRMLTLQAQPLTPYLGYDVPPEVTEAGCEDDYVATQRECAYLYDDMADTFPNEAPYAVTLAHRIRFAVTMNAREAMHLIELRSQPQGHETYRVVAQEMHRLIDEEAGHRMIAEMMRFVDRSSQAAGRLAAERRQEERAAKRARDRLGS